ncbi:Phosphoglycerate dehydrogenase [Raineyella antarctica]|uniref:Phosphoglycerate dehydrogenase n=1 Tax=Raineyella antarctica TaxID=1577474 RepID=A0A1G6GS00_9ACTN|nr:NAD(P)-dependent oxidoreductase [Raineyella antarctica]SDB84633.1 Phosphoglycerate dehydrogenase [Raineyella antarctica]
MGRVAWLPYTDLADAEAHLGRLPEGIDVDFFTDEDATGDEVRWPDSVAEVEFLVLPYLSGSRGLGRVAEMPRLQVVQSQMAGYEHLVPLIPEGVTLCTGAGIHDTATAELALALALANLREIDVHARNGADATKRWQRWFSRSLADRRAMILGYGRIGHAIRRRLEGFETAGTTLVARHERTGDLGAGEPYVHPFEHLPELLPATDVVFVICPLTEQTEHLLDAEALALLPDGALVVNVARGRIVDTDALLAECASGRLRAALDVTDPEPLPTDHPLWTTPGVTITPHVGGWADAFTPRADALIGSQLRRWAAGEPLRNTL